MDITHFEALARRHLRKLLLLFFGSTALSIVCYSVADWAYSARGWQSEVAGLVFYAVAGISGLFALIFGISIYAWFSGYRVAKSEAAHYGLEDLERIRGDVVGPIQWR